MCVLQRYLDEMFATHRRLLTGAASPKAAIHGWLDELIATAPAEGGSCRGCFAMNTLVELGPYDERARSMLEAHFDRIRMLLIERIRRGQELGELRRDIAPEPFSRFLMTLLGGVLSSLKGAISRSEARELAETALQLMA
jgi:TetR/AcrR family transcriptional repressor of nem operon